MTGVIGQSLQRVDAFPKVTGKALYLADLCMPRMLECKVLRSPYPHARILGIDVSRAAAFPGVKAVITAHDTPGIAFGPLVEDELPLADCKVRYVGDEVAAVAAIDEDTAEEALRLIRVEYEELPAVFDPLEAMSVGAPLVHDSFAANIASHFTVVRGDPEKNFREADLVVEDTFSLPPVNQVCLETQGCISYFDGVRLTMWVPTQSVFRFRSMLANSLRMPISDIRIIQTTVGGAFGSKIAPIPIHLISAILSIKTGLPIRIMHTREEEFSAGRPRVGVSIKLAIAGKNDGTVTGKRTKIIADNGAYSSFAPRIVNNMAIRGDCLYRFKSIYTEAYLVYTNKIPTGAYRGYGNTQMNFALETMIDRLADRLGIDPVEIRLKNAVQSGDTTIHGWKITSCGLKECIEKASSAAEWTAKRALAKVNDIGIGIACAIHVSGSRGYGNFDGSAAEVHINDDGTVHVITGECEIGQGSQTVLAQIVAEELSIPMKNVKVASLDTDTSPECLGAYSSRTTVIGGNAILAAARDAKVQLLEVAAEALSASPQFLRFEDGLIVDLSKSGRSMSISEAVLRAKYRTGGKVIVGQGNYDPPTEPQDPERRSGNVSIAYTFGAHIAEVIVDGDTGQVRVTRYIAAHDLGQAINTMAAEGQVEGGVAQGLGYALMEQTLFDRGLVTNANLVDYKIPTINDVPIIQPILVQTVDSHGPFGAKGIGEPTQIPVAAAVANAIRHATGVAQNMLPMTAERLYQELRNKGPHTA